MRQLREICTLLAFHFFCPYHAHIVSLDGAWAPFTTSPLSRPFRNVHQKQLEAVTRERDNLRMVVNLPIVARELLLAPGLS
jgi:hypothetical protein